MYCTYTCVSMQQHEKTEGNHHESGRNKVREKFIEKKRQKRIMLMISALKYFLIVVPRGTKNGSRCKCLLCAYCTCRVIFTVPTSSIKHLSLLAVSRSEHGSYCSSQLCKLLFLINLYIAIDCYLPLGGGKTRERERENDQKEACVCM